jgi:FKBP-type peptidyl-prolyl cis-trans isomerase
MNRRVSSLALGAALSAITFLPACGKSDGVTGPSGPTTLEITDTTVGTGATAAVGDTVTVHYIGAFLNGTVFDNSYASGAPLTFQLGAGRVIRGFEQGIVGMKVGGKRLLVIPSSLAYGAAGNGSIPPNTPIQFQVELLSIAGK